MNSCKGWRLSINKYIIDKRYDNRFFLWCHQNYEKIFCRKYELLNKFPNLDPSGLCRVISGEFSHHHGWHIEK